MCALAGGAAGHATCALLEMDAEAAGDALADVEKLHRLHKAVERDAIGILALQAPVASDLRAVVGAIHIAADADRMGGLAQHVAETCLRRLPVAVLPDELGPIFAEMGQLAVDLAERSRVAVLTGDRLEARRVREGDDAMEALHRQVFQIVTSPQWPHGQGLAVDAVLLGRFYGRFADHAGEIARRVGFQTTGSYASA
jgi:phosphate transport system protein